MAAPHIRADFDTLMKIAQSFGREAADTQQSQQAIRKQVDTLESGDWIGKGANAFYQEMSSEILPSLKRLSNALQASDRVTRQIAQIMQEADREAASVLRLIDLLGIGLGIPGSGASGGATEGAGADGSPSFADALKTIGEGADSSPSLWNVLRSAYEKSIPVYKAVSGADSLLGIVGTFTDAAMRKGWVPPKALEFLAKNPYYKALSRGLAVLGFGADAAKFATDPGVQSGADLTASGFGLYGAFASGPGALLASAFAGGYAIGKTFIAPYTTEPLSNLLYKWDPLDLRNSARNYPKTTIKDYERAGKDMPVSVAKDVYKGLLNSSSKDAAKFARDYSESKGISYRKFLASTVFHW